MQEFISRVSAHVEHVRKVGNHCTTEETTKQALILPLLDVLGFSPYDPTKVRAEFSADFPGVKSNERVDYALFCDSKPVMFVEAKAYAEKLVNHAPQLSRYFNSTPDVTMGAITNGREWRFFTDLNNKNVMDGEPFLTIDFLSNEIDFSSLFRFRHDEFQPDALRGLAEESVYLAAFKSVISNSMKDVDADFVRYVAGRAQIQRQLTSKFIDMISPIVRKAVERAVSEMVVSGLSAQPPISVQAATEVVTSSTDDSQTNSIDPNNTKIVTTIAEKQLFSLIKDILGDVDVQAKDTESYFTILYQGKVNRWVMRYHSDKKRPSVTFIMGLNDTRQAEIKRAGLELAPGDGVYLRRPEDILRISGLLSDALAYCQDDENFKVKK